MLGWEKYPIALPHSVRWVDDVYNLGKRLEQNCECLFVSEPSKIQLEVSIQGIAKTVDISTITYLEEFLMMGDAVEDVRTKIFMISQRNAWTRLKISSEMFMMLCHFYRVFPKFLECVFRFSLKTCKTEEYFSGGCYRLVHEGEKLSSTIFQISYNIRYFKLGRSDMEDPWLSYQCSVYQNYSHQSNTSTWILINIPIETRCHLERLNSEGEGSSQSDHPMVMHLHLLLSCETNWSPYIGYLGGELSLMNQAISFPKRCTEFDIDISNSLSLALLRRKLEDASSLLSTNLDNASTLLEHADDMQQRGMVSRETNERFRSEVRQYQLRIRCHIRNVQKHICFSEVVHLLIFKIMDLRSGELLTKNSSSRDINKASASEKMAMISIAHESKVGSQNIKFLTLISLIYLPISLVTSFFGTQLLQFPGEGANIVVRKQTWIYVVITTSLVLCTSVFVQLWRRRERKLHHTPAEDSALV
ncbi:hypothetical protein BDD12DRAFT_865383 [Trichophaea hybrida]|nr:hypothetical protein BDD12DRAFT_865383 [Trichophaea hybrida]